MLQWRQNRARDRLRFSDATLQLVADEAVSQSVSADARSEALEGCLRRVSPQNRRLLNLHYRAGDTVEAIAEKVGRTPSAIYRALSRTRQFLHGCVKRAMLAEGDA